MRRAFVPVALCLALLAGCGDDDEPVASGSSTTTGVENTTSSSDVPDSSTTSDGEPATSATPDPTDTSVGIDTMPGADTEPKSGEAEGGITHLVSIETGRHEGFDRVVFAFDGPLPGYTVQYVDPPILADASGDEIAVQGGALLEARFEPASGFDTETVVETYTGPDIVAGNGTSELIEVVRSGDFEAVLHWVLGLQEEVDFRVDTQSSPSRVIIDVRNH